MDCCGLNEVTPLLSADVWDVQERQYELKCKVARCHATAEIANMFFSVPLVAKCR